LKAILFNHHNQELRTPLNTAYLGLKLLTDELKESTVFKDIERYDTLHDVNRSCEAAIDILNDLLCFEKLESGILELHREEILVQPYLLDCLSMFKLQARECGVTMHIDTQVPESQYQVVVGKQLPVTLLLQSHDTISIDRFKVNFQIQRILYYNVYKVT
jgi:signal transduction histidine kinase